MKTSENSFVPEEAVDTAKVTGMYELSDPINVKIREMARLHREISTASYNYLIGKISKEERDRIIKTCQDKLSGRE